MVRAMAAMQHLLAYNRKTILYKIYQNLVIILYCLCFTRFAVLRKKKKIPIGSCQNFSITDRPKKTTIKLCI